MPLDREDCPMSDATLALVASTALESAAGRGAAMMREILDRLSDDAFDAVCLAADDVAMQLKCLRAAR